MNKTKLKNLEIQKNNQNNLRELEQFYTTNEVTDMFAKIEEQKNKITEELVKFQEEHTKPIKWDDEGNPIAFKTNVNPLVINNYFFKSIISITSQEPMYNAEKLGLVFDYYCFLLAEVNDKIGNFPSSLTSFCKLAGITLNTLRNYKNSDDLNMRIVTNKIYDQIGDENITMGQMGIVKERTTMFKLKSQNEMVEKAKPNVNINLNQGITEEDVRRIEEKLSRYRNFTTKKEK